MKGGVVRRKRTGPVKANPSPAALLKQSSRAYCFSCGATFEPSSSAAALFNCAKCIDEVKTALGDGGFLRAQLSASVSRSVETVNRRPVEVYRKPGVYKLRPHSVYGQMSMPNAPTLRTPIGELIAMREGSPVYLESSYPSKLKSS